MQKYNQLSLQQRYQIQALLANDHSQSDIARTLGVHRATISRELNRNVANRGCKANTYVPDLAQRKTDRRHRGKPKRLRLTRELKEQAKQWLTEEQLSPELISGRWYTQEVEGVSHETLYQWIWAAKRSGSGEERRLYRYLKHGRRRRKRGNYNDNRGHLSGRVGIEKRPQVVEERRRLGDIEVDLMVGKAHKAALLVLTDRSTLLTALQKVNSRNATTMAQHIISRLATMPTAFIKTLTFDNDKAFAQHRHIARHLGVRAYFTRPYTSQDKGTVENRIGVIRRFFPKGTDLTKIGEERIKTVERYINYRPVRKFDYLNPIQQTLKCRSVALIT